MSILKAVIVLLSELKSFLWLLLIFAETLTLFVRVLFFSCSRNCSFSFISIFVWHSLLKICYLCQDIYWPIENKVALTLLNTSSCFIKLLHILFLNVVSGIIDLASLCARAPMCQVALTFAAIQYGRAADASESRELLDEAERALGRRLDRAFDAMYRQAKQVLYQQIHCCDLCCSSMRWEV